MTKKKWLLASGLALTAPLLVVLWIGTIDSMATGNVGFGWSAGVGRTPGHASSAVEFALITLMASAVWLGGAWKAARMWRQAGPR